MLAADSVAINHLHVKGDKRRSQALIRELEQTSWLKPLPAHLQQAWILVRELSVKGKARDLRHETAQHLNAELQSAVRAIQGDAASANAIWFATFPELLAFLLVDLALGKATQWYWSRWAHVLKYTRHEAIARLLCEHSEHMPAVMMQLQSRRQLALVFAQLTDGSAKTLVRELARVWHFPDPVSWHAQTLIPDAMKQDIFQALRSQAILLTHWRPLLQGLNAQDGRVMLATALHGLTYTPLWLQQQPSVLVDAVASLVCRTPDAGLQNAAHIKNNIQDSWGIESINSKPDRLGTDQESLFDAKQKMIAAVEQYSRSKKENDLMVDAENAVPYLQAESRKDPHSDRFFSAQQQSHVEENGLANQRTEIDSIDSAKTPNIDDALSMPVTNSQPEGYEFITRAGGFFYLLNPLRQLLTEARLATQTQASVWYWLLDLYRVFVREFPALEALMDESLRRFILRQWHPEADHHELQQLSAQLMSTPPSEFATALFADLATHYQQTDFWCELNGAEGFFATPARVVASASHWDIYFPLSSVRLDVRLVGWDINPGWLPWLGRVVNFHYVEPSAITNTPVANAGVSL